MNCKFCGEEVSEGLTFCPECGKRLDGKKVCPSCGGLIDEASKFCGLCGSRADGKKACPSCGAVLDEKTAFCSECGTDLGSKEATRQETAAAAAVQNASTFDKKKFAEYACNLFAGLAALVALIFTFLIGCKASGSGMGETVGIFDYFGKEYKDLDLTLFPAANKLAIYIPKIIGTILSAASILLVVVFSGLAAYSAYNKKQDKFRSYAIKAFMSYAACATMFFAMHSASSIIKYSYDGSNYFESSTVNVSMNGATLAGLIIGGICAGYYFISRIALGYKQITEEKTAASAGITLLAAVFAVVLAAILSGPVASMSVNNGIYSADQKVSFMIMLSATYEAEIGYKIIAFSTIGCITGFAMIAVSVRYIINKLEVTIDRSVNDNGLQFASTALVLSAVQLVMAILTLNEMLNALGANESGAEVSKMYAVPIAAIVFAVLIFAAEIILSKLPQKIFYRQSR